MMVFYMLFEPIFLFSLVITLTTGVEDNFVMFKVILLFSLVITLITGIRDTFMLGFYMKSDITLLFKQY